MPPRSGNSHRASSQEPPESSVLCRIEHATSNLIEFDRFEERAEIALAETLVAAPLDDLEEDRTDHRLREDLQQQSASLGGRADDQDAVALERLQVETVAGQSRIDPFIISVGHIHELHAVRGKRPDGGNDIAGLERDVLNALTVICREIFGDLRLVVGALVDGNANLAAWARHRLGAQPRELALDIEIADLAEVEEVFVELGPESHAAPMHIVRQVIDRDEPDTPGLGLGAGDGNEIDIVDRMVTIAIDQIDQAAADPLDRGNVEFHRADLAVHRLGAESDRALMGLGGVAHAKGDRADRGTVQPGERLGETLRFGIDDEVDIALAVERHLLGTMASDHGEAHALEEPAERRSIRRRILHEFEPVGPHGIVPEVARGPSCDVRGHDDAAPSP